MCKNIENDGNSIYLIDKIVSEEDEKEEAEEE